MKPNPIAYFHKWYTEELKLTNVRIPMACCLSTIGTDGYPNARFVSLKEIVEDKFIITGTLTSRKGIEINHINRVALTFWWTATERQVRIQGTATAIPDKLADKYFAARNRDSQIVSLVSDQGQDLPDTENLTGKYLKVEKQFSGNIIPRPGNWGGFSVEPIRIEFLAFKPTRFHERKLFTHLKGQWVVSSLQP